MCLTDKASLRAIGEAIQNGTLYRDRTGLLRLWLAMTILTFQLSACGFHLRGMMDMPPWLNQVHIIVENANHDLLTQLSEQLRAYHIQIAAEPTAAHYWLIIEQDNLQQRLASISSSTTPRQYQLSYKVRFKLQRAHGEELLPPTTVTVIRQLTINSNRILGSNDEATKIAQEMRHDAAIQIMNRLGAIKL